MADLHVNGDRDSVNSEEIVPLKDTNSQVSTDKDRPQIVHDHTTNDKDNTTIENAAKRLSENEGTCTAEETNVIKQKPDGNGPDSVENMDTCVGQSAENRNHRSPGITISSVTSLSPNSTDVGLEKQNVSMTDSRKVDTGEKNAGDQLATRSEIMSHAKCTETDTHSRETRRKDDDASDVGENDERVDDNITPAIEITPRPEMEETSSRSNNEDAHNSQADSLSRSGNGEVMCLPTDAELMREMYSHAGEKDKEGKKTPSRRTRKGTGEKRKAKEKTPEKKKQRSKTRDESSENSEDDQSNDGEADRLIHQLREKAGMMLDIFNSLADHQQLAGLDVFQGIVNAVVNKITLGRVKSVKFVPVEDGSEEPSAGGDGLDDGGGSRKEAEPEKQALSLDEPTDATIGRRRHPRVAAETSRLRTMGQVVVGEDGEVWVKTEPLSEDEDTSPDFQLEAGEEDVEEEEEDYDDEDYVEDDEEDDYEPRKKKLKKTNKATKSSPKSPRNIGESSGFRCRHCRYSAPTKSALELHQIVHSKDRLFQCNVCNKLFTAMASLKRHKMAHEGIKPHTCPICNKCFIDVASLRTHAVVHTGERLFKCDQCPKQYTNSANLSRHKRIHTGEMPYECNECGVRYRDLSSLKLHMLKHTGEKPYSCEDCGKQFKTSSDLRRHERTHTQERNYACKICNKTFIQGWHVKQHMRMHEDIRPWKCEREECGKRFRTKSSLQHHERGHAGIKDYKCSICNKSFSTKKYLFDHQVIHTDAKPYKCKTCGQDFNQLSNLRRHERMHSDVRQYKCKYCGKAFKYINSWRYHEGIHKNELTQCTRCGLYFRSKNGLKYHKCDASKYEENMEKPPPRPKEIKPVTERRPTLVRRTRLRQFEPVVQLEKIDAKKLKRKSGASEQDMIDASEMNSNGSEKCYKNLKKVPVDDSDPKMVLLKRLTQIQKTGPKSLLEASIPSSSMEASPKKIKGKDKVKKTTVVNVVKKGKTPAPKTKQKTLKIKVKLPKKPDKSSLKKGATKPRGRPKGSKNKQPSSKKTKKTKKSKGVLLDDPEIVIKTEPDPWPEQPLEPVMLTANMAAVQSVLNQNIEVKVEIADGGQTPGLVVCQVRGLAPANVTELDTNGTTEKAFHNDRNDDNNVSSTGEENNQGTVSSSIRVGNNQITASTNVSRNDGAINNQNSSQYPADPVFEDLGIEVEMNWGNKSNSASPTKAVGISERETSDDQPGDSNERMPASLRENNDEPEINTPENPGDLSAKP